MIVLNKILQSLRNPDIKTIAKIELQKIPPELLPLQQGMSLSSSVSSGPISIVILNIDEKDESISIKSGVFYTGIISGCSCSDDPSPLDEQNEYCEIIFLIDKKSAETSIQLLNE